MNWHSMKFSQLDLPRCYAPSTDCAAPRHGFPDTIHEGLLGLLTLDALFNGLKWQGLVSSFKRVIPRRRCEC